MLPALFAGLGGLGGSASGAAASGAAASGGMLSTLGSVGTAAGGIGSGISSISGLFGKKPKPVHVPTGLEMGKEANDYYNTVAPGTTPWERLGAANPSGGVAQSTISSDTSQNVAQIQNNQNKKQLAFENAKSMAELQLKKYEIDTNAQKIPSEINRNSWGPFTPIKSGMDWLSAHIGKNKNIVPSKSSVNADTPFLKLRSMNFDQKTGKISEPDKTNYKLKPKEQWYSDYVKNKSNQKRNINVKVNGR